MKTPINMIPEVLKDFNVYEDGTKLIGVSGQVTLPPLEAMTETISGAGIAGEYETTVQGFFGPMSIEIPFEMLSVSVAKLYAKDNVSLTLRGSVQMRDLSTGTVKEEKVRVVVDGMPTGFNPGQFAKTKKSSASVTVQILRFILEIGGEEVIVIDKPNGEYRVFGVDKNAATRENT